MSSSDPPTQPDQALVSVRPRLRGGGRGGSTAGDGGGGVAGPGHENSILSQLAAAKPVPLRPPLAIGLPPSSPPYSDSQTSTRSGSCPGPVHQLLHQQLTQKLSMTERDRQIAMVEEELKLTRKMMELEIQEKEVHRMARQVEEQRKNEVVLSGFGRFGDVACESETSVDMFKQMETARQEELARLTKYKLKAEASPKITHSQSSNEVTRQKVREMLERKKREMFVRNGTNSSAGSSLKDAKKTEVQKDGHDVFNSDEENEQVAFTSKGMLHDDPTSLETDDLSSVLGEVIPDQEIIWERIQRERRDEEDRISGMKHNEVVQEQQEILRKIQEQNLAKKREEELTLKLIAEMSVNDQRQQQQQHLRSNGASTVTRSFQAAASPYQAAATQYEAHPSAATALPASARNEDIGEDWRVVGARVKEKVASLRISAELDNKRRETAVMDEWRREMLEREEEERRRQLRKWEVNQKVRVVKSVDSVQDIEDARSGTTFRDILLHKNNAELNEKPKSTNTGGRRELGARRKSEGVGDIGGERKKAPGAEDLKTRMIAQEKDLRARVEKEALEREWELATRRRETGGISVSGQERTGQVSRQTKLEQNMNQKMKKQK